MILAGVADEDQKWLIFLSVIFLFPFFYVLFSNGYVSCTDETYQLQAAYRLANGQGNTCFRSPPLDLSIIKYDYLVHWPPGYSLAIASLMKLGISLDAVTKLFKALTIILGIILWLKLSNEFITNTNLRVIFLTFICITFTHLSFSPTDLFLLAVFPFFSHLMLSVSINSRDYLIPSKKELSCLILSSVIVSILILMKYQSLVFIPIGILWLLIQNKRKLTSAFIRIMFFCLPPSITYFTITYLNLRFGGSFTDFHSNSILDVTLNCEWWLNAMQGLLQALLAKPFFVDKIISFLIAKTGLNINQNFLIDIFSLSFALLLIYIFYKQRKKNLEIREITNWFLVCLFGMLAFLGFLTIFYRDNFTTIPLANTRYYSFLISLLIIIILSFFQSYLQNITNHRKFYLKIFTIIIVVLAEVGIIGYSNYKNSQYILFNREKEIIRKQIDFVLSKYKDTPAMAVANNPYINMLLWEDYIHSYRKLDNEGTFFGKPTLVFIIDKNLEASNIKVNSNNKISIAKFASLLNMNIIDDNSLNIYWKLFDKGKSNIVVYRTDKT